jgi:hypothetical protein
MGRGTIFACSALLGATLAHGQSLPSFVDNSTRAAFPPIGTQGTTTCSSYAATYYSMSHETCLIRGCNNKVAGSPTVFSPTFTNHFLNRGNGSGTLLEWNYAVQAKYGAVSVSAMPDTSDVKSFHMNTSDWLTALNFRTADQTVNDPRAGTILHSGYSVITDVNTSAGRTNVKQKLFEGHIVTFGTAKGIYWTPGNWGWQIKQIPASSPSHPGEWAIAYDTAGDYDHASTIVGYDDNIWVDVNGNGSMDSGEMGAYKVANAFGTNAYMHNQGFVWLAYDAVNATSTLKNVSGRVAAIGGATVYYTIARASYTPKVVAQFTVNHPMRDQLLFTLGTSPTGATSPTAFFDDKNINWTQDSRRWSPWTLSGAFAFNGGTTAVDGTFVMDFTDLVQTGTALKYYLQATDTYFTNYNPPQQAAAGTLKDFRIINLSNNQQTVYTGSLPLPLNAPSGGSATQTVSVTYTYTAAADTTKPRAPGGLRVQ